MPHIQYALSGGLMEEQLAELHHTALRVLHEEGVEAAVPELLERVEGKPGIRIEGSRVRFDPSLVEGYVEEYRATVGDAGPAPDNFTIDILTGYAFRIHDLETDTLRPITTKDCVRMAKLVDGLRHEGVQGGTPGMPQDAPAVLREVLGYKLGVENCRTASETGFTCPAAAFAIHKMAEAAKRPFGLAVFVIDPLKVDGDGVRMALRFIEKGIPVPLGFSSMPLQGLTAPIHLPGAFVSNVATVLGAYSLFRAMDLPNPLRYHFDVYPFDLRIAQIAYGTPEHVLMYLLGSQVNRFYGADWTTCKPFHTNAAWPDAHAMAQRASFATAAAFAGGRRFTFGGMLGVDKVFSACQLLLDIEIVRHVETVIKGFDFDWEHLSFDAIRRVGAGGSYMTEPETLIDHGLIHHSALWPNLPMEQGEEEGPGRIRALCHERAEGIIEAHDFSLPDDTLRELEAIYAGFQKQVL